MRMTLEEILKDVYSDRVKKVIYDADSGCDLDDQFAIAHSWTSKKIDLLSVNSTLFRNEFEKTDGTMEASHAENQKVVRLIGAEGLCPVYPGCTQTVSSQPGFGPVDSPAVRNIIDTAMASDEIIYILATGALTNVASAILTEPAVMDHICVIWVGSEGLDTGVTDEYNLFNDYRAGQIVLNSGVPFIHLPGFGCRGTVKLALSKAFFDRITLDSEVGTFFKKTLPDRYNLWKKFETPGNFHILWDVAASGFLSVPQAFTFSIIPAPVFTDDGKYAYDSTRHKIVYMEDINPNIVMDDVLDCINTIQ